jgi:hypothetical protein
MVDTLRRRFIGDDSLSDAPARCRAKSRKSDIVIMSSRRSIAPFQARARVVDCGDRGAASHRMNHP